MDVRPDLSRRVLDSRPYACGRFLANGPMHALPWSQKMCTVADPLIIISYDGTANDDDALALGRMLALDGARLELAYVRHAPEFDPERESLAQHDAEQRLDLGAERLGDRELPRHIVFGGSTGASLQELAAAEGASTIVFGSDYRTTPGHAEPPTSAQQLLEIGEVAFAVAAAGLRADTGDSVTSIAVLASEEHDAAKQTADELAEQLGTTPSAAVPGIDADLIVVGSQPGAPGRTALSGYARSVLDASRGSVLVVPSGKPVVF
jgi:nucleotide-binding universal stress UspA family protein